MGAIRTYFSHSVKNVGIFHDYSLLDFYQACRHILLQLAQRVVFNHSDLRLLGNRNFPRISELTAFGLPRKFMSFTSHHFAHKKQRSYTMLISSTSSSGEDCVLFILCLFRSHVVHIANGHPMHVIILTLKAL